jgi:putative tryptophan/tyrosine transport system substrate-binding protein
MSSPIVRVARRMWLGVTLIVAASGFLLYSDMKQRNAGPGAMPRIAIFQFNSVKLLDDGVHGLIDRLAENGYVNGKTAIIERFNAENDMPTANSIARQITTGEYGYVVSISTNCLQATANANVAGRAKHIFGVVADPSIAKVGVNPNNPLDHPKHMVGIGSLMQPREILMSARQFNPRIKRFGLPWNPSQANSERFTTLVRAAAKDMGLEIMEAAVDNTSAVGEAVSSLVSRGAEAILALGDLTVAVGIDAAVGEAKKGRIPIFSVMQDTVAHGALYAAGPDYYNIGKQMGDLTTRVLKGEDMTKIPIIYDLPVAYAVNLKVLPGLKDAWNIPDSVLAKAVVIR